LVSIEGFVFKRLINDLRKREEEADRLSKDKIEYAHKGKGLRKLLVGRQIPFLKAIIADINKLESKEHKLMRLLERYDVLEYKKDDIKKMVELIKQLKPSIESCLEIAEKQVQAIDENNHSSLQELFDEENSLHNKIGTTITGFQKEHSIEVLEEFKDNKDLEKELNVVRGNFSPFRRVVAFASVAVFVGLLSLGIAKKSYAIEKVEHTTIGLLGQIATTVRELKPSEVIPEQSFGYGKVLLEAGKFEQAMLEFRKVYELHPTHELADDALFWHIKTLSGSYKATKEKLNIGWMEAQLLELRGKYPHSPYIDDAKALIRETKNYTEPKAPEPQPIINSEYFYKQAEAAYNAKDYKKAEMLYKTAIKMDPHNIKAYIGLFDSFKKTNPSKDYMIDIFQKGQEANPRAKAFPLMIKCIKKYGKAR